MLTALHDEETQGRTFELLVDGFIQTSLPRRLHKQIEAVLKRHYGENGMCGTMRIRGEFYQF